MRLIEKVDNNGQLLYYRFEPLQAIERNSTGWWDFKKHHADDGKTYYSYQEPDDNMIVGWGIPGDNDANNRLLTEYDATGTEIFSIFVPKIKNRKL